MTERTVIGIGALGRPSCVIFFFFLDSFEDPDDFHAPRRFVTLLGDLRGLSVRLAGFLGDLTISISSASLSEQDVLSWPVAFQIHDK